MNKSSFSNSSLKNAGNTNLDKKSISEQLIEKENEQSVLLCLANAIAAARNRDDLGAAIKDNLLELFAGKYYTLCITGDDKKTHASFVHSRDNTIADQNIFSNIFHLKEAAGDDLFHSILSEQMISIIRFSDVLKKAKKPFFTTSWQKAGIRQMLAIPFVKSKNLQGVFCIYSEKERVISKEQFNLFTGVTALLNTGVSNIISIEKAEQQLKEINQYKKQLEVENLYLQEREKVSVGFEGIIGKGKEMQKVFRLINQVAASDATVLILGETGTGKELVARAVHNSSNRKDHLMIKINCAALPPNLIESELFGHERGSFTGASERRIGKFELANNSTIFLDEIAEMPLELQVKLLRVLQEKEVERIGGSKSIKVNVRIVAATNRNLQKEVATGRFRSDLYYRLNVFPVTLPALRNRKEDIPELVNYFMHYYSKYAGKKITLVSPKAIKNLMNYSFPGNIRELEHLIQRAVLITNGKTIKQVSLPQDSEVASIIPKEEFVIKPLKEIEKEYILKAVKACNGKISGVNGAAVKLGIPSTTLTSRMQKLGMKKRYFFKSNLTD